MSEKVLNFRVSGFKAVFGPSVVLVLTKKQASARHHALDFIKGDRYRPRHLVEFKNGEEIGVIGDVDNIQKAALEPANDAAKDAFAKKGPTAVKPAGQKDKDADKKEKAAVFASPSAEKLAADNKLTADDITGTGKDGNITVNDVKKAIEKTSEEAGNKEEGALADPDAPGPLKSK